MSDRDALLAAILANPDDDTPRLVYADWLQENGEDDRAEFIRVQCRIAQMRHGARGWDRLLKREKALRVKLFAHLDSLGFANLTFSRGFVGTVESGALDFLDRASALTADVAPAFEFTLTYWGEDDRDRELWEAHYEGYASVVGEFADRPEMGRCVSLNLPCLGLDPSSYFFDSDRFTGLRRLNFPSNEAGPNIEAVASPTFANLRWANFNYSNSANGRPSIIPLAECPHLANLDYLDFGANALVGEDAKAVASASQWAKLRFLSLSSGWFPLDAITALFNTPHLPALTELDFSYTFGSLRTEERVEDCAACIADSALFARLSTLRLSNNEITDDAAKILAASPREPRLTLLDMSGNPISAAGKRALRKRFGPACVFDRAKR